MARALPLFLLCLVALGISASVTDSAEEAVIKETWRFEPEGWTRKERCVGAEQVELILAVRLSNTDALRETLRLVSDPDEPSYGQHLSQEEVSRLIAPEEQRVERVLQWLQRQGLDTEDPAVVSASANYDFIKVKTTIATAERMLQAQYYRFEHTSGLSVLRTAGEYSLPVSVADDMDFVSPTVRFPVVQKLRLTAPKTNVTGLGGVITPDVLRTLYGVGKYSATNPANLQACASFLGQFYSPSDLQTFFKKFDTEAEGHTPKLYGPNEPSNPGTEASLDIQYVMAMGNNVSTQFWSTAGEQPHNPENEPFLVWLTNVSALSDNETPRVISVSYGDNENGVNFDYAVRVNAEFMKLGTRGVSILFSSGDGGVAGGQSSPCPDGKFIPTFPAGSPYVTAVGGTSHSKPEVAASFSSGGFSNYWDRPEWQTSAVSHYFSVATNLPPSTVYNHTGRGFPDVSAQAESFNVVQGGGVVPFGVDGTSCSAPTFSGIMSLLNDVRLNAGKTSLGFLNPLFYKNPSVFNDVTSGSNPGCNTNGFSAAAGWDPVTGLGTPNFPKMAALVKSLP